MDGHKSPPPFVVERTAWLAGKTCGSGGEGILNRLKVTLSNDL